jgi:hypothetical protein
MAIEAALAHAWIVEPRDIMLPCVSPSWPTSTKCCVNSVAKISKCAAIIALRREKLEFSAAEIGALAHLYRGEVYRSTV